jgi:hypothetical protein
MAGVVLLPLSGLEEPHCSQSRIAGVVVDAPGWGMASVAARFDHGDSHPGFGDSHPGLLEPLSGHLGQLRSDALALDLRIDRDDVDLTQIVSRYNVAATNPTAS